MENMVSQLVTQVHDVAFAFESNRVAKKSSHGVLP